ncbi:uncharacterized protein LOC124931665 [Impatiens glandulifera]|uniref:uncharacterized protein LOC124931665 n=1 Tax=Impatiens glandulifera TaxID=253017 RepID=UPI001FB15518|nr:uncharacterized protein LOC124931665 [Impatiens glandulifera]
MERKAIVICSVVGFLGLLSAVLGFAAEGTKIKASQVEFPSPSTCIYPKSPALSLGLSAAISLMVAQIILNVATGCICCKRGRHQQSSNWTLALVYFVVSWFTFVVAFLLMLTGAALNDQHGEESMYFGNYYCYVVKPGVFSGAALLSVASVGLGIAYFLAVSSTKNRADAPPPPPPLWAVPVAPPNQGGIVMGQTHVPPPQSNSQDPVFVHEDTYMRRQLV